MSVGFVVLFVVNEIRNITKLLTLHQNWSLYLILEQQITKIMYILLISAQNVFTKLTISNDNKSSLRFKHYFGFIMI